VFFHDIEINYFHGEDLAFKFNFENFSKSTFAYLLEYFEIGKIVLFLTLLYIILISLMA
jgi:hypothetical protein